MLLVLLDDQLGQLHTLMCIQLAAREQGAEVDEQRRGLARLRGNGLELLQCLPRPQSSLHRTQHSNVNPGGRDIHLQLWQPCRPTPMQKDRCEKCHPGRFAGDPGSFGYTNKGA